jgi:hypothetical protein
LRKFKKKPDDIDFLYAVVEFRSQWLDPAAAPCEHGIGGLDARFGTLAAMTNSKRNVHLIRDYGMAGGPSDSCPSM